MAWFGSDGARPWLLTLSALLVSASMLPLAVSCSSSSPRTASPDDVANDVYVWRRTITDALRAEMRDAATSVSRFKVLAREHEGEEDARREVWVDWQPADFFGASRRTSQNLPARDVVLVWRIGGLIDEAHDVAPLLARAQVLRAGGVHVTAIEVDHDCPTRQLRAYAGWLHRTRAALHDTGLRLTITALPTWATDAAALAAVALETDGITVQVHTVKAPVIFDVDSAAHDVDRFVAALPAALRPATRVALPTYRATLRTGEGVSVTRDEIARFRQQQPWPRLSWFRLGASDDSDAWGAATLTAVIQHDDVAASARVQLIPTTTADVFDVSIVNAASIDVDAPAEVRVLNVDMADGLQGYSAVHDGTWRLQRRDPPRLRPGAALVVGWVRGSGVVVAP